MKSIFVITYPQNGWDCVIGVVENVTEGLRSECDLRDWIIHERRIKDAEEFLDFIS